MTERTTAPANAPSSVRIEKQINGPHTLAAVIFFLAILKINIIIRFNEVGGQRCPSDLTVPNHSRLQPSALPPGPNKTRGDAPFPSLNAAAAPSTDGVHFPTDRRRHQNSGVCVCVCVCVCVGRPTSRGTPRAHTLEPARATAPRVGWAVSVRRGVRESGAQRPQMSAAPTDRQPALRVRRENGAAVCAARSRSSSSSSSSSFIVRRRSSVFGRLLGVAVGRRSEGRRRRACGGVSRGLAAR